MEHGKVDYDRGETNSKGLIVFLISFLFVLSIIIVGIFYLIKTNKDNAIINGLNDLGVSYEVEKLHKYESQVLNEYGVIDEKKGIYKIPIEKAMEKVIKSYR